MERVESDSLGEVKIPADKYWGAQTQRSLENFAIGDDVFPELFIKNYALLKKCAALSNQKIGKLDKEKSKLIVQACDEIIAGKFKDHFPLKVWQTGSGTQTNMNLNEVISNRAAELAGGKRGEKTVHPNDHVNMSQSSNDTFPTAMRLSAVEAIEEFFASVDSLVASLNGKAKDFSAALKIGRTHLMDAVPMLAGQEFATWARQLNEAREHVKKCMDWVYELPIGGTAIGTGLNASPEYVEEVIKNLNKQTKKKFLSSENKFSKIAAHDSLAALSGAMKVYAGAFMKVANDIRLLGSGPRCGLSELLLPANEPGSSIMPGKVNPTQCEAAAMVCVQVMGNDVALAFGAGQGQLQLNTYKPLIIHNLLRSIALLRDASKSFDKNCVKGIELNREKLDQYLERSLMLVTSLTPRLGYEKCSKIAQKAYQSGSTIREEVLAEGLLSEAEFDKLVDLKKMV